MSAHLIGKVLGDIVSERIKDNITDKVEEKVKDFFKKVSDDKAYDELLESCKEYEKDPNSKVTHELLTGKIISENDMEELFNEYYRGDEGLAYGKTPKELKADFYQYMKVVISILEEKLTESDKIMVRILDRKFANISKTTTEIQKIGQESAKKMAELYEKFINVKPFVSILTGSGMRISDSSSKVHCMSNVFDFASEDVGDGQKCLNFSIYNSGECLIDKISISNVCISAYRTEEEDLGAYYPYTIFKASESIEKKVYLVPKNSMKINVLFDGGIVDETIDGEAYEELEKYDEEFDEFLGYCNEEDDNSFVVEMLMKVSFKDSSLSFKFFIFISNSYDNLYLNGQFIIDDVMIEPVLEEL